MNEKINKRWVACLAFSLSAVAVAGACQKPSASKPNHEDEEAPSSAEKAVEHLDQAADYAGDAIEESFGELSQDIQEGFQTSKDYLSSTNERLSEEVKSWRRSMQVDLESIEKKWARLKDDAQQAGDEAQKRMKRAQKEISRDLEAINTKMNETGREVSKESREQLEALLESLDAAIDEAQHELEN